MNKKETFKFIVQLIAAIASAVLTALGTTSCMWALTYFPLVVRNIGGKYR